MTRCMPTACTKAWTPILTSSSDPRLPCCPLPGLGRVWMSPCSHITGTHGAGAVALPSNYWQSQGSQCEGGAGHLGVHSGAVSGSCARLSLLQGALAEAAELRRELVPLSARAAVQGWRCNTPLAWMCPRANVGLAADGCCARACIRQRNSAVLQT